MYFRWRLLKRKMVYKHSWNNLWIKRWVLNDNANWYYKTMIILDNCIIRLISYEYICFSQHVEKELTKSQVWIVSSSDYILLDLVLLVPIISFSRDEKPNIHFSSWCQLPCCKCGLTMHVLYKMRSAQTVFTIERI